MNKIRVLVLCRDNAGVGYYRQNNPHLKLTELYGDIFEVTTTDTFDTDNLAQYENYDIIHFHRNFVELKKLGMVSTLVKNMGIKLVMDIDDYWKLGKEHPNYNMTISQNSHLEIIENIKIADYVTTTTPHFKKSIQKYNPNVEIFVNAIDPNENQFKPKLIKSEKVRVGWVGGSSHEHDINLLQESLGKLFGDSSLTGKFQMVLCGYDLTGKKIMNELISTELRDDLVKHNLWHREIVMEIEKNKGNLSVIQSLPVSFRQKWKDYRPSRKVLKMQPKETVWYRYEKIFTNNHDTIKDENYLKFLETFRDEVYDNINEQPFKRIYTLPVKKYATHYNNIDISLAPLLDTEFNNHKSPLKMIESGFFKKPIIVSDVKPYDLIGTHGVNCFKVSKNKNHKFWYKYIKQLILDEDMRNEMGQKLYDEINIKYDLTTVTQQRKDFYKKITNKCGS